MNCPKCAVGMMRGPRYCSGCLMVGWRDREHLHYYCERCGYVDARPTADKRGIHALLAAPTAWVTVGAVAESAVVAPWRPPWTGMVQWLELRLNHPYWHTEPGVAGSHWAPLSDRVCWFTDWLTNYWAHD